MGLCTLHVHRDSLDVHAGLAVLAEVSHLNSRKSLDLVGIIILVERHYAALTTRGKGTITPSRFNFAFTFSLSL